MQLGALSTAHAPHESYIESCGAYSSRKEHVGSSTLAGGAEGTDTSARAMHRIIFQHYDGAGIPVYRGGSL